MVVVTVSAKVTRIPPTFARAWILVDGKTYAFRVLSMYLCINR